MTQRRKEALHGYLFAAPWLIGLAVFMMYPLVASVYFSFCDYSVLKKPMFIGTANYVELFHDEVFWKVVLNTGVFAALSLPLCLITALLLAMLLNSKVRGMAFYRTLFFLPSLVPTIPMAVLWLWLLNGQYGIVNQGLGVAHIHGPDWLGNSAWSKPSLVLMSLWGVGGSMLIYLAVTALVQASFVLEKDFGLSVQDEKFRKKIIHDGLAIVLEGSLA